MLGALFFGLIASSALVIGGVVGAYWRPPRTLVAAALAFASGALITALAFDLFEESFRAGGAWFSGIGLLAGAAAFVAADEWLDRHIEIRRRRLGLRHPRRRDARRHTREHGPGRLPA